MGMSQLSDESLLVGFGLGDRDSSVMFVRRFQAKIYGLCLAVLRDPRLAEDVAQRTFERAYKHATTFDARRGSVQAWLLTIARHLSIDVLRVRVAEPVDPTDLVCELGELPNDPERLVVISEGTERVRAALRNLSPDQARAVVLSGFMGFTAKEIAERENIPLGTAKTRIRTALTRLRNSLDADEEDSEV
jgi:RNA polymerase sigma factor (sigma-70 family)